MLNVSEKHIMWVQKDCFIYLSNYNQFLFACNLMQMSQFHDIITNLSLKYIPCSLKLYHSCLYLKTVVKLLNFDTLRVFHATAII